MKGVASASLLGVVLAVAPPVAAAESESTALARQHFERGYAAARSGDLELAAAEFERAYAASPNASVLFNLGQAYASMGRAVEAVDTLERYLELGGTSVPAERRALVESLIAYHSRAVGELALEVSPPGAEVTLDGRKVGAAPFAAPLRVTRGTHAVRVSFEGHEPNVQTLEVRGGERASVRVALRPVAPSARLHVSCAIPDVTVKLDGRGIGRTPLRPLALVPGAHDVSFERAGYVSTRRTLKLAAGEDADVVCALQPTAPTPAFARLVLTHPAGTRALLDEAPFTGRAVPAGRHRIAVVGPGHARVERTLTLAPGATSTITLVPSYTESSLAEHGRTQRIIAFVTGGAGLVLGAAALSVYVYNDAEHEEWQRRSDAFSRDYATDPRLAPPSRLDELLADERAIRNRDSLALGAGVFGGALLAAAVALYVTAPSEEEPALTVTGSLAPVRGTPSARVGIAGAF